MVGEEMMKAITYFDLKGEQNLVPVFRASMLLDMASSTCCLCFDLLFFRPTTSNMQMMLCADSSPGGPQ